jgi:hypothetical protein
LRSGIPRFRRGGDLPDGGVRSSARKGIPHRHPVAGGIAIDEGV